MRRRASSGCGSPLNNTHGENIGGCHVRTDADRSRPDQHFENPAQEVAGEKTIHKAQQRPFRLLGKKAMVGFRPSPTSTEDFRIRCRNATWAFRGGTDPTQHPECRIGTALPLLATPRSLLSDNLEAEVGIGRLGASMTLIECLISLGIQDFCSTIGQSFFTLSVSHRSADAQVRNSVETTRTGDTARITRRGLGANSRHSRSKSI